MAFFNILAVLLFNVGQPAKNSSWAALRSIFTNPLILAAMAGFPLAFSHTRLPLFLDRALEALGGAAIPIALLCIGGSFTHAKFSGKFSGILTAAVLKTFLLPTLVLGSCTGRCTGRRAAGQKQGAWEEEVIL
jgi:hypothetical protein